MMNAGLVLLQKDSRYFASEREIRSVFTKSAVTLAPTGYPDKKPTKTAKLPFADTENKRCKRGLHTREIYVMEFVWISRLVIIKNGKSVGNTIWNHSKSPSLAPDKVSLGKQSIRKKNKMLTIAQHICFIDKLQRFC